MTDVLTQTLEDLKAAGVEDWTTGTVTQTPTTLTGSEAVWSRLLDASHAWVECTGCVLWRECGGAWRRLGQKHEAIQPDPRNPAQVPLRAEAMLNDTESIAIAHHHGEDWRLTMLTEGETTGMPCLQRAETQIAVVRARKLIYHLYWTVEGGQPIASAFKGFGEYAP